MRPANATGIQDRPNRGTAVPARGGGVDGCRWRWCGVHCVVPVAVEAVPCDRHGGQRLVVDLHAGRSGPHERRFTPLELFDRRRSRSRQAARRSPCWPRPTTPCRRLCAPTRLPPRRRQVRRADATNASPSRWSSVAGRDVSCGEVGFEACVVAGPGGAEGRAGPPIVEPHRPPERRGHQATPDQRKQTDGYKSKTTEIDSRPIESPDLSRSTE